MDLPSATIVERTDYIKMLIEEERPASLLRIMRKSPLMLLGFSNHHLLLKAPHGSRSIWTVWIEYDGLDSLKGIPYVSPHLEVPIHSKEETTRIIKILELMCWPPKFNVNFIETK